VFVKLLTPRPIHRLKRASCGLVACTSLRVTEAARRTLICFRWPRVDDLARGRALARPIAHPTFFPHHSTSFRLYAVREETDWRPRADNEKLGEPFVFPLVDLVAAGSDRGLAAGFVELLEPALRRPAACVSPAFAGRGHR
jgi:hypothetical protein